MTQIVNQLAMVKAISEHRRQLAAASPKAFAQVYLGNHFVLPPSRMHEELFEMLARATEKRNQHIAVAAPRGHAKSTVVALAYVLWSLLYEHDKFVLLVSATGEQAKQLLKHVKDEIQGNPRLLADFPEVCHPPGSKSTPKPWRAHQIALHNGAMVRALGGNQAIRGMRHREHRPSLVVIDDLENQEQCESSDQRFKLKDWFEKTLLKVGDEKTNFIVVGTILHYDSLLANLTFPGLARGKGAGWEHRIYRAVESFSAHLELWEEWEAVFFGEKEYVGVAGPRRAHLFYEDHWRKMLEGTRVLWPEREDYRKLMEIRATEGRLSFQSEKQNEPLDPDQCMFNVENFRYWDDEFSDANELMNALGKKCTMYGACDPSMGNRVHRGDYTAIITLMYDHKNNIGYVLDADIARRKPDQTINRIIDLARIYRYRLFAFEANQFQGVLADQLQQRAQAANVNLYPRKVIHTTHKESRIQSLEPMIASGRLRFSRRHTTLLEQLRQYPLGAHDDGPDALAMAAHDAVMVKPIRFGRTYGLGS